MDSRQQAILKTLIYSDLFDYPLTRTEIFKFLISKKHIEGRDLFGVLSNKILPIEEFENYFYLVGRKDLVLTRQKREKVSLKKLQLAKDIIKKISYIPSIKLIGISGALSMNNCDEDDDIDLFVITSNSLVWTTRLLLVILLTSLGIYRNRNSKNHANKICLNMILDESHTGLAKENRDLYTAHEIVQLLPVFNKENTYEKFINENAWVRGYLPNFSGKQNLVPYDNSIIDKLMIYIFRILQLEKIAKFLQLSYMKNHKTSEVTNDGFLKFHPYDYKTDTLREYKKMLSKYSF